MHNPFDDENGKRRFSLPKIIAMILGGTVLAAGLALLFGWIVMVLWNWLMPEIFHLPEISFWQAWGLVILSHILIKPGFGHGPHKGHRHGPQGWRKKVQAGQECCSDETPKSEKDEEPQSM